MKLVSLVLTCVAVTLISLACAATTTTTTNTAAPNRAASPAPSAAAAAPGDEFAAARTNFAKHCEGCHGPSGEGGPVKTPDNKTIKVPSLKAPHAMRHSDDELVKTITNGEEEMPAFKDKLKPEEITEMVRFVRKHFQGK
jgi:mono/diheme cytochrome c family protein